MNRFKSLGKVMGAANIGMSFVSMGFSIASAIRVAEVQKKLDEKREE